MFGWWFARLVKCKPYTKLNRIRIRIRRRLTSRDHLDSFHKLPKQKVIYHDGDTLICTRLIMTTSLSRSERFSLFTIFGAGVAIIANSFNGDGNPIVASLAYSGIAFSSTYCLIRWLGDVFMKAGFKGKDMSKARKVEMCVRLSCRALDQAADRATARRPWAQFAQWCIFWLLWSLYLRPSTRTLLRRHLVAAIEM